MKKKLSIILRELRRDMSLENFSKFIDISRSTLERYEKGVQFPNAETILKICEKLDISSDYLLGLSIDKNGGHHLSDEEENLINEFRNLDIKEKTIILGKITEMNYYKKTPEKYEFAEEINPNITINSILGGVKKL